MTALLCLDTLTGRLSRYKRGKSVEGLHGVAMTHRAFIPEWQKYRADQYFVDQKSLDEFRRYPERVYEENGIDSA